jgi:hypothetical protein
MVPYQIMPYSFVVRSLMKVHLTPYVEWLGIHIFIEMIVLFWEVTVKYIVHNLNEFAMNVCLPRFIILFI